MTLNPFVFGNAQNPSCFDEKSPCLLEQTSMCVIDIAQKKDASSKFPGQSMYVPWLICMDSTGDQEDECHKKVGIDPNDVKTCMAGDAPQLLKEYLSKDESIRATPTVHVNGKNARTSFGAIKAAICGADPSLQGCQAQDPPNASWEPEISERPLRGTVVV
jgi:hypothetical protein